MKAEIKPLRVTQTLHTQLWAPRGPCGGVGVVRASGMHGRRFSSAWQTWPSYTHPLPHDIQLPLGTPFICQIWTYARQLTKGCCYHLRKLPGKQFCYSCVARVYILILTSHYNFINQDKKIWKIKLLLPMISIGVKCKLIKANVETGRSQMVHKMCTSSPCVWGKRKY